ncbi:hypothetical protein GQ53DRAFT_774219 [Thozetella sp. PMI_491]|nr:hypothetical protein GQ53DRAFT_774219 [Thozetella sp. PMI_491]
MVAVVVTVLVKTSFSVCVTVTKTVTGWLPPLLLLSTSDGAGVAAAAAAAEWGSMERLDAGTGMTVAEGDIEERDAGSVAVIWMVTVVPGTVWVTVVVWTAAVEAGPWLEEVADDLLVPLPPEDSAGGSAKSDPRMDLAEAVSIHVKTTPWVVLSGMA